MDRAFKGRREDRRLVTGMGRYSADWRETGELYAHFVRSDRAHADISLDVSQARHHTGVVLVLTHADTAAAGITFPPPRLPYPGRNGPIRSPADHGVFASSRVRYVGEEIAMVVATSALAAQDAAETIVVDYRELPAAVDVREAAAEGAVQIHAEYPGNLAFDFEYGDETAVNEAMPKAAHVTRIELESARLVGNPMEPKACLAAYDAAKDLWDIWTSTQGMTLLRDGFAGYGISPAKVRVHAQDVGGGFGIRGNVYPEYVAVMLASKLTGRPVKWVASRSETFLSDYHGRALRLAGELGLDASGRFVALRIEWLCDLGAYPAAAGPFIDTYTPRATPTGVYAVPAVYARNRLVVTNTVPITAYRGAGRPDGAYLIERLVEQAARETGIERIELRRRNLIPKEAFPYKTPTGSVYDSGDYRALLDRAIELSNWNDFESRRAESAARGQLRGIGCSVYVEPAGPALAPKDQTLIKFGSSGAMELYSVAGPSGQGHETVLPEIAARELGVDPQLITARIGDPDGPPLIGGGTAGSRSMSSHGAAALMAAREVIKKGMALAAQDLEVSTQDLEFVHGQYRVKGTDKAIGLLELARKHAGAATHPMDAGGEVPAASTFPSGVHVAELELDPDTGASRVLAYTTVDDCGRVVNHTLLEGQMQGGIMQGAGQVFEELCIYDPASGQLLTGSFMDYAMPRADRMPSISVNALGVPSPANPLGVKGAGEAGTTGSLAALVNSALDALAALGIQKLDMPFTPERVWQAMRRASLRERRTG